MSGKEDTPDWMLFPSEREDTNDTGDIVRLDETTVNRLDDIVEASHSQTRGDVISNLVYDEWMSEDRSKGDEKMDR